MSLAEPNMSNRFILAESDKPSIEVPSRLSDEVTASMLEATRTSVSK